MARHKRLRYPALVGAAVGIILASLLILATVKAYGQDFQHVYNGFKIYAERVPDGAIVEMSVEKDRPEDIVFPLPDGTYNIYISTPTDTMRATGYLRLNASAKNVQIGQGSVINISGGTTQQALILIDTAGILDPVISVEAEANGHAWTMWEQGPWYFAYVDTGYEWNIGDYRFRPKAGEVWKLNEVVINYMPDSVMTGPIVEPEPEPPAREPITIEGEQYTACTCPPIRPSVTGTPGLGGTGSGSWAMYPGVDLTGMRTIEFRQSSVNSGRTMEIRIDATDGPLIGTYSSTSTGAWETYNVFSTTISPTDGIHDLYFVFLENAVMDIDKFTLRP